MDVGFGNIWISFEFGTYLDFGFAAETSLSIPLQRGTLGEALVVKLCSTITCPPYQGGNEKGGVKSLPLRGEQEGCLWAVGA